MSWKVRLITVGLAWITIPWVWGVAEQQRRRRAREDGPGEES